MRAEQIGRRHERARRVRARVVAWPAPLGGGVDGVYGIRLGGLPSWRADGLVLVARRVGLWATLERAGALLQGPAPLFAALHDAAPGEATLAASRALELFSNRPRPLVARGRTLDLRRPLVVGILNATPDSFYDCGRYFTRLSAVSRADEMVSEGADAIEVGGQSARPGPAVGTQEEIHRVLPLIEALRSRVSVPLAVDTFDPVVARGAVQAGAMLINDISGLADLRMAEVAAETGSALVVMHIQGRPKERQVNPQYEAVVDEVYAFLEDRTAAAVAAGVARSHLLVDPGFSFGKAPRHDLEVLGRLGELRGLGYPIYLATSRKNYIRDLLGLPFEELLEGTAAAVAYGLVQGANLIRTHDVRFMARLVRMMHTILQSLGAPPVMESPTDGGDSGWARVLGHRAVEVGEG